LGRLSNKPSTKSEKWPTNFRPSPDTHLHHLRPPQNELGLHRSGSGPGTHQRTKLQFHPNYSSKRNMQLPRLTSTSESLSTSQRSSTQNKPLPECLINFWTNTKNRSNQVPNPTWLSAWPSPKGHEKISGTSLKHCLTKRRSQRQASLNDSSPLVISITPMAKSTFENKRHPRKREETKWITKRKEKTQKWKRDSE